MRVARAVHDAARTGGREVSGVYAYLANAIRARGTEIPYSVIAAADLGHGALRDVRVVAGAGMPLPAADARESIWLNEAAWRELGIAIGEPIEIDYYRWEDTEGLVTRTARFTLAGVVSIGGDVNAELAPDVEVSPTPQACATGTRRFRWTCAASVRRTRTTGSNIGAPPGLS